MKFSRSYLAALLFVSAAAFSQITITNSNLPGNGDTLRYSNAQLSSIGNYTQTGTNFVWNYSTLVPISQGVRAFKNAISTPYAFFFLAFNEYGEKIADTLGAGPLTITQYYNYYKKQPSPQAFIVDGSGMTFSSIPVPSYFSDKDELYMLPMTYPKYDSTTFKFSTPTSTLLPFTYTKAGYRVTKVDGYGTVTTPFGTSTCLRLITTQYSQDSIKTSIFPIGFKNYQRSYQWMTSTTKIPFLEVTGSLVGTNFTPTTVRYRDNYLSTGINTNVPAETDMVIYPNPVNEKLNLRLKSGAVYSYEIYNMEGKLVGSSVKQELNSTQPFITVDKLPQGLYNVSLKENGTPIIFKFIKQ